MNCQKNKSPGAEVSSSPLNMSSPAKRQRLDESENVQSIGCDESASGNSSMDSNSSTSSNKEVSSEIQIPKGPLEIREIVRFMQRHANYLKSSNTLKDFPSKTDKLDGAANFPFVVESYDPSCADLTFSQKLQKMIDASYADLDKNRMGSNFMFEIRWNELKREKRNETATSYKYTEEQVKCYKDMKGILERESFHVCVLTGESGTGKTICLKQFCDDPEIDFIYIAQQNSLCKEGCQTLNIPFERSMTLTRLSMIIFDIIMSRHCFTYQEALKQMTIEKLEEIGLPTLFKVPPRALNVLFAWGKNQVMVNPTSASQKLVLCIDKFNMINSNELYMIKCQLQRLVSASTMNVNVILLLCGDPFEMQPLYIPVPAADDELTKKNLAEEVVGCSTGNRRLSGNSISTMKLGQTHFQFKTEIRSGNPEYRSFLKNLKNSSKFGDDVLQCFDEASKVRKIPYQYCVQSLLDLPAPNRNNSHDNPGAISYLRDVAEWVQSRAKDFNSVTYYCYKNTEVHYMNLSIALSIWQQCLLFNETAAQKGHKEIPQHLIPRLAPIHIRSDKKLVNFDNCNNFERMPVLPLIIGWRYKVLCSEYDLKLGEMVTLVHIEYKDAPQSYKNISHLLVVTTSGDLIIVKPGSFHMTLFQDGDGYLYLDENSTLCGSLNTSQNLYGFPLQLAFARTVRGSLGSSVEGDIYCNLTFFPAEEAFTLLTRIQDPCQIKGLAWIK